MKSKTKVHKTYNYLLRICIVVATWGFVYKQLFYDRSVDEIESAVMPVLYHDARYGWLALLIIMMLLNWGLEALKWQKLIVKIEKLSFFRSFKAVMSGVSVSMFTPNRVGEFFGRVFILKKGSPLKGILVTIVGSYSQLTITLVVGLFGLLFFLPNYLNFGGEIKSWIVYSFVVIIPFVVFGLLLLYFNVPNFSRVAEVLFKKQWPRIKDYVKVFSNYSKRELFIVLILSLFRYIVFSLQFYLMLWLFNIEISYMYGLLLISVIYFMITVIPTIALAELGIRGSIAVFVIGRYLQVNGMWAEGMDVSIFMASTLIWIVNLVIPAILGTLFVFQLKFFRK